MSIGEVRAQVTGIADEMPIAVLITEAALIQEDTAELRRLTRGTSRPDVLAAVDLLMVAADQVRHAHAAVVSAQSMCHAYVANV
ncbi:hypothetical protein ACTG9Q_12270 [Actinokineospora sp. 24-640]